MNANADLERLALRVLVAEGLVTALTNSAVRLTACLHGEMEQLEWTQKTGREGWSMRSRCYVRTWDP
jgi:hypothetical protein